MEEKIKKLASLIIMSGLGKDSPRELLVQSSIRAHFMSGLSGLVGLQARNEEMFLLGLFQNIDAILNKPMSEVMEAAIVPLGDAAVDPLLTVLREMKSREDGTLVANALRKFLLEMSEVFADEVRQI